MNVKQVYTLLNDTVKEVLGDSAVVQEDLTGLVELGDTISNAVGYDKYVGSLVNHIGRVIFVNRKYQGSAPSVLMDGWEYGSILEKISADLPEATENESWELTDGATYEQDIFYQPKVSVKFFNKKATFEIPMSFTEKQVKQSFVPRVNRRPLPLRSISERFGIVFLSNVLPAMLLHTTTEY